MISLITSAALPLLPGPIPCEREKFDMPEQTKNTISASDGNDFRAAMALLCFDVLPVSRTGNCRSLPINLQSSMPQSSMVRVFNVLPLIFSHFTRNRVIESIEIAEREPSGRHDSRPLTR